MLHSLHTWLLHYIMSRAVDITPLPESTAISLRELFGDDLTNEWETTKKVIQEVFKHEEFESAISMGERRAIWYLIRRFRPRSVLEIGTHIGGSTLHIAMALKSLWNDGALPRFVTVDYVDVNDVSVGPWVHCDVPASPRDMLNCLGCDQKMTDFVVARSLDYLVKCEEKFDFVFLDGDHKIHTIYQEICITLGMLRPGGCLLLHDYFPDKKPLWSDGNVITGPYLAVERLRRKVPSLAALPLTPLPWPNKLNSNASCLALLVRE